MKPSAILFDLDGTLVDTITLYEEAVLQSLKEIGINATHEDFYQWYTTPLHLAQIIAKYGMTEDRVPELRARRDELYIELLKTRSEWLPGARELLTQMMPMKFSSDSSDSSASSPTLGLVTGSWMSYVDAIDVKFNLKPYFQTIITADEIHRFMKPHPHGLLLATDRLGVDPKNCIYIGDQEFDREAAIRAGMDAWIIKGKRKILT